jgi:hypothetical protein
MEAIFNAIYTKNMGEEDTLRIIYYASNLRDKLPKGKFSSELIHKAFDLKFIAEMGLS